MEKDPPSIEYLRERLRYEPETGKLFWREHKSMPQSWNTRWGGKEALAALHTKGYLHGVFGGKGLKSHRVIWAIEHGFWPVHQIDHIDGNRSNNRIENLRDVIQSVNMRNAKKQINNASGFVGVRFVKDIKRWQARINIDKKNAPHLGYFDNIEDAIAARQEVSQKHGYTERHGT
jgi:hypothetical protein